MDNFTIDGKLVYDTEMVETVNEPWQMYYEIDSRV